MPDLVTCSLHEGVASITMDDGKVNALSPDMQRALHGALDRAEAESAIVSLRGREGIFSAGFDLGVLRGGGEPALAMVIGGFELARRLLAFPRPVLISCTGHAIAMGAFLLLAGDYRVGARGSYRLSANEVAIGLTLPRSAGELLRQRLTPAAFNRAATCADVFSPDDGLAAGFLDRLVEADALDSTATEFAIVATKLDDTAHRETKLRIRHETLAGLDAAIAADRADLEFRAA